MNQRVWGFTYNSFLTWVNDRAGLGFWVRNRVELLLIGTKGSIPAPAPGEQPPQVMEAPRTHHSEKPERFAEIIENGLCADQLKQKAAPAMWPPFGLQ